MSEHRSRTKRRLVAIFGLLLAFVAGAICHSIALLDPIEENVKSVLRPLYVKNWPGSFKEVSIASSVDSSMQKAMLYRSTKKSSPLVISLHTWGGDWATPDPLAPFVQKADWNYIHPDFRGRNDRPEACLGPAVVSDIDDAIRYGLNELEADERSIVVVGMSGGGHAALGHLLKSSGPSVRIYSVWCPVTDVKAWFYELQSRGINTDRIQSCCCDESSLFDPDRAIERSPLHMDFGSTQLGEPSILLRAGVLDGTIGTVPFSHSVYFFNQFCEAMGLDSSRVNDSELVSIYEARNRKHERHETVFSKKAANMDLSLFFGHHEMLSERAMAEIRNVLACNQEPLEHSKGSKEQP